MFWEDPLFKMSIFRRISVEKETVCNKKIEELQKENKQLKQQLATLKKAIFIICK